MHGHHTIIAVYSPTEEASVPDKDNFYNQLAALSSAMPHHDQLVVLGEFNASSALATAYVMPGWAGRTASYVIFAR